jgi:hypothetical protein
MFSKISNKNLGLAFAALLILVIIIFVTDGGRNERTFREELVTIDTSTVTEILIYPKSIGHKEVKLYKEEKVWKVNLDNEKTAVVPQSKVSNLFAQLLPIKPKRLAARGQDKWGGFQVDSTGTRVKIVENGKTTLDIILGRFSFKQPRSMSTFVRLAKDADIYEVDGFLEMSFNQDANYFRDGTVINDNFQNWTRISFDYPADSSFQMIKVNEKWMSGNVELDSADTEKYLRQLARLTGTGYIDDEVGKTRLINPMF